MAESAWLIENASGEENIEENSEKRRDDSVAMAWSVASVISNRNGSGSSIGVAINMAP